MAGIEGQSYNNDIPNRTQRDNIGERRIQIEKKFDTGKILGDTIDDIEDFGLQVKNSWDGVEIIGRKEGNYRVKIDNSMSGTRFDGFKNRESLNIPLYSGTLELKSYTNKGETYLDDGKNGYMVPKKYPDSPLRLMAINRDGSTNYITITKIPDSKEQTSITKVPDSKEQSSLTARDIDTMFKQGNIKPSDVVSNDRIQEAIIKNWNELSDASVFETKNLIIEYAKSKNPRHKLSQLNPNDITIFNSLPILHTSLKLPKVGEKLEFTKKDDGFTIMDKKSGNYITHITIGIDK